jgi:hypothetical protein
MTSPLDDGGDPTRSPIALKARRRTVFAITATLLLLFATLVALRVHGFSLAAWHEVIDGSAPGEVLLGEPRLIRSDDWKMYLPLLLAQNAQTPRFPVVNPSVGLGQNMLLPVDALVAHWVALFRPTMWGFLLGPDAGIAWLWWSRVLGLFGVWFAVLAVVTRGRLAPAATGAALLVCAPFFQFWTFNSAPQVTSMGAAFLATVALARARGPRSIVAAAIALALSGSWFALSIYPPYQVTLGWLYVALVVGWLVDARDELPLQSHIAMRGLALAAAGVCVVGVVAAFASEASDAIALMRDTAYPGRRMSTGADRNLAELWNANLGAPLWAGNWGPLYNICEAASFWMLSPVPIALVLWRRTRGERIDALMAAVAIYALALTIYTLFGIPAMLARVTALSFVPGKRAVIGIGLADAILMVRFAACSAAARHDERGRVLAIAVAWLAVMAGCSFWLARELPDARLPVLLAFALGNAALAAFFLQIPRRALLALVALSAISTLWFNPIAVGGAAYLRDNALAQKISEIDRAEGGDTTWVSFGRDDLPNLFRAIGVRALNGVHPIPQLELWKRIDPDGRFRNVYNRYAHIAFVAAPSGPPRFQLHSQDYVIVQIRPDSEEFRALGVTHVLVRDDVATAFERMTRLEPLATIGPNNLYHVSE